MHVFKGIKNVWGRFQHPHTKAADSNTVSSKRTTTRRIREIESTGKAAWAVAFFKRPLLRKRVPTEIVSINSVTNTLEDPTTVVKPHEWLPLDPAIGSGECWNAPEMLQDCQVTYADGKNESIRPTYRVLSTQDNATLSVSVDETSRTPCSTEDNTALPLPTKDTATTSTPIRGHTAHLAAAEDAWSVSTKSSSESKLASSLDSVESASSEQTLHSLDGRVLTESSAEVNDCPSDAFLAEQHLAGQAIEDFIERHPNSLMLAEQATIGGLLEAYEQDSHGADDTAVVKQQLTPSEDSDEDTKLTDELEDGSQQTTVVVGTSNEQHLTGSNSSKGQTSGTGSTRSKVRVSRIGLDEWEAVRQVGDSKLKQLLQSAVGAKLGPITTDHCHIVKRLDGGFNHIVMMVVATNNGTEHHYVVRIPAIGTSWRWQEGDAHNMRCEVALMKYLHQHTKIPTPEVLLFEDGVVNSLGAPFILMKRLPGHPAYMRWFEDPNDMNYLSAGRASPKTEAIRCNILRSLATIMAELQNLEFDKIGIPDLAATLQSSQEPAITHAYRWAEPDENDQADEDAKNELVEYGPFASSSEFMTRKLDEEWPTTPDPDESDVSVQNMFLGVRKILDIIYDTPAISSSKKNPLDCDEKETFVLRHPDLDLQNILIDRHGNVTGIIDWEGCMAVPRCVGYASYPEFLRRDWASNFSFKDSPYLSFRLNHYRRVYADAMLATGCVDAKYTRKSAMYRAIVDAVNGDDNCTCDVADMIQKLFAEIPDFRTLDHRAFEMCLGAGWQEAEEVLAEEIQKLLDPET